MKFPAITVRSAMLILISMWAVTVPAQAAEEDAQSIVARSLQAFYYAASDMQVRVTLQLINDQGKERRREMTLLRKNIGDAGEQRYFIYFHAPNDVKGTSFMVWKYLQREDDRWIFIPSIKLVRRIAADDKRSSFIGSDFTYEDVSGRDVEDETHTLLRSEEYNGRTTFVIESRPKEVIDYARRISWIDQEHGLPLREEYYDIRDQQVRLFSADKVENIDGHWTITSRTMKNLQTGHRTVSLFESVQYDVGLEDDLFSERYLRNPPRRWIR